MALLAYCLISMILWDLTHQASITGSGENIAFVRIKDAPTFEKREVSLFPDVLDVNIEFAAGNQNLRLEKQENLDVGRVKVSFSDGSTFKPKRTVAFYQDLDNMAAIMVEAKTENNRLERTLTGTLISNKQSYEIKPASKSLRKLEDILTERGLGSHDSHMMHVLKEVNLAQLMSTDDHIATENVRVNLDSNKNIKRSQETPSERNKRAAVEDQTVFHIEMMLLVDYSVYSFWLNEKSNDDVLASEEVVYFYSHIFNGMFMSYRNIDPANMTIVLWLTEIQIIKEAFKEIVSGNAMIGNVANGDVVFENLKTYLTVNGINSSYTDNVQLWTKKDLKVPNADGSLGDILGLAYTCSLCLPDKSLSQNEDRGYYSWLTGAHELGHNLGAAHDNDNASDISVCYKPDSYIMSPVQSTLNETVAETALSFSSCSIDYFLQCLTGKPQETDLDFPRVCTYDTVCSHDQPLVGIDDLPGKMFSLDQQCQLFVDPTYTYFYQNGNCGFDYCHLLYCVDSNGDCMSSASSDVRAAVGTPCDNCGGSDCVCYRGDCVEMSTIESPVDDTPQQCKTTKYIIEDDSACVDLDPTNCPGVIEVNPWRCFSDLTNTCKRSCFLNNLFYIDSPPCAFTTEVVTSIPETTSSETPTTQTVAVAQTTTQMPTTQPETTTTQTSTTQAEPTTTPTPTTQTETVAQTTTAIPTTQAETTTTETPSTQTETGAQTTTEAQTGAQTTQAETSSPSTTSTLVTGECIPLHWACDQTLQCATGGDEDISWCQSQTCPEQSISCPSQDTTGQIQCIPESFACDGETDCYYSNDETISWCEDNGYPLACYYEDYILCPLNRTADVMECIPKDYACDGYWDCYYSDEENIDWCEANGYTPKCYDIDSIPCPSNDETFHCVGWYNICDGTSDCPGDADEVEEFCRNLICPDGMVRCPGQDSPWLVQCIDESYLCDGFSDCYYELDESKEFCESENIAMECHFPDYTPCLGDSPIFECVDEDYFCDGYEDCYHGKDEDFDYCKNVHEGPICYFDDEIMCPIPDDAGNIACMYAASACDGWEGDCPMGTDEDPQFCHTLECPRRDFTYCPDLGNINDVNRPCLPFDWACDGWDDCLDGLDENPDFCHNLRCNPGFQQCPEPTILECVPEEYVCDGFWDCYYSDEEEISWCKSLNPSVEPTCYLPGEIPCPIDDSIWVECINKTFGCDGILDCSTANDEDPAWCAENNLDITCYFDESFIPCIHMDANNEAHIDCLPPGGICDESNPCEHGKPCEELTCLAGFERCPNLDFLSCVNETYICDGLCDCEGCTDENITWCSSSGHDMKCFYDTDIVCPLSNTFGAENYFQCIPPQWACDGIADCVDGLDEDSFWCTSFTCDDYFVECPVGINLVIGNKREHQDRPKSKEVNRKLVKGEGGHRIKMAPKEKESVKSVRSHKKTQIIDKKSKMEGEINEKFAEQGRLRKQMFEELKKRKTMREGQTIVDKKNSIRREDRQMKDKQMKDQKSRTGDRMTKRKMRQLTNAMKSRDSSKKKRSTS